MAPSSTPPSGSSVPHVFTPFPILTDLAEDAFPYANSASADSPISPDTDSQTPLERLRRTMPRHYSKTELSWTQMVFSRVSEDSSTVYLSLITTPSPSLFAHPSPVLFSQPPPSFTKELEIQLLKTFLWNPEKLSDDGLKKRFATIFGRLLNESGVSNIQSDETIKFFPCKKKLFIHRSSSHSPCLHTLTVNDKNAPWPNISAALQALGSYIKNAQQAPQQEFQQEDSQTDFPLFTVCLIKKSSPSPCPLLEKAKEDSEPIQPSSSWMPISQIPPQKI